MTHPRTAARNFLRGAVLLFGVVAFACTNAFAWMVQVPVAQAAAGINRQIPFQGRVVNLNGTTVVTGLFPFTFSLYTAASGGAPIWTETKTLTVSNSIFGTNLGSSTSIPTSVDFNQDGIYLGINFNGDGEMVPRLQIGAVPQAINAEKVSGLTVTNTTGTLTIPNSAVISFGASFTTGADPLSLVTTGATSITLPTTGVLATLAGTETFTNKTLGVTSFSGNLTPSGSIDLGASSNRFANLYVATADATTLTVSGTSTLGTVTGGTWQGSVIAAQYGGTGINTSAATGIPVLAGGTWSVLANGSNTQCLIVAGGVPTWGSCSAGGGVTGGGVTGQLSYWDSASTITNAAGLTWNAGASQLGVGTASTIAPITVRKASSGIVLAVRNTADSATVLSVNDTGDISANSLSLANGLTVSAGTVSLPAGEIGNAELANSSLTVSAGTNLSGGGSVSLGGTTTLNIVDSPSFATSATAPTINATTSLQLGGVSINTSGTLSNVAYLAQVNAFTAGLSVTTTGGNQISSRYDGSNRLDISTGSTGSTSLTATGTNPAIILDATATGGTIQLSSPAGSFAIQADGGIVISNGVTEALTLDVSSLEVGSAAINGDGSGTISGFTWTGNTIGTTYGGTGITSYATGDMIYASGANTLAKRSIGSNGDCLVVSAGIPTWGTCAQASTTLQAAYNNGRSIALTDARDFAITLANTTTDSNVLFDIATGSTGRFAVQSNGTDVFAVGAGGTTITSGGLTVATGTVSLPAGEIGNAELANSSLTLTAGTNLSGGGSVSLGGSTTVNVVNNPTFSGTITASGAGVGLSVTNDVTIGGTLGVTGVLTSGSLSTGAITGTSLGLGSGSITSGTINGQTISSTASFTGTLSTAGALTVVTGGASITGGINNNAGDITNAGTITGVTGITTSGGYTQSGSSANTFTGATTFSATGTALSVTNNASVGGTLTVTGAINGQTISSAANFTGSVTVANGLTVTAGAISLPTGSIANAALANSSLTVTAGTGLTGGGVVSLGGSTTLSLPNIGSANTYGSASQVPVFTTDAQGRVTGVTPTSIAIAASAITTGQLAPVRGGTGFDSSASTGLVYVSGGAWSAFANGADNQCLVTSGGVPTWGSCSAGGGITGAGSAGSITYWDTNTTVAAASGLNFASGALAIGTATTTNGTFTVTRGTSGIAMAVRNTADSATTFSVSDSGAIIGTSLGLGSGTITSGAVNGQTISSAANFTGSLTIANGLTVTAGVVSLPAGSIDNVELANSSMTVTAGTNLSGGGSVSLGGSTTLNIVNNPTFSGVVTAAGAGSGLVVSNNLLVNGDAQVNGILYVSSGANIDGGLTLTGGLDNDSDGITNAGTITGATISGSSNTLTNIGNGSLTNSSLTVTAGTNLSGGGSVSLGGSTTLNIVSNPTFTGLITGSNTGGTALALTGAPGASATQSLLRLGSAIVGGDADGTFLGINALTGYTGNLVDLQVDGTSRFSINENGNVVAGNISAGTLTAGTYNGQTISSSASFSGSLTVANGFTVTAGAVSLPAGSVANAALANSSITVTAGTGLAGGGSVSLGGTVSLNLPNVGTAGTYGSATQVPVFTTDAQGRITGVSSTTITVGTATLFTVSGTSGSSQTISGGDTLTIAAGTNTTTTGGATDTITIAVVNNPTFSGVVSATAVGTALSVTNNATVGGILTAGSLVVSSGGASITGGINNNSGGITNTGTVTGATISGGSNTLTNIANGSLTNSSLTVTAGTNLSGGGTVSLGGSTTLNIVNNPTFSGLITGSNTGGTALALSGAPAASTTQSLLRLGNAIVGGDADGTFIGLNAVVGYTGNLVDLQVDGTSKFSINENGNVVAGNISAGTLTAGTYNGQTISSSASFTGSLTVASGFAVSAGAVSLPAGSVANAALANSSITVTAGTGLSGGGSVALGGTVSLNLPNVGTAGTYGSATQVPVFTTDAQGRITGVSSTTISVGTATLFTVAGTSGSSQTISGGDTLTIGAGSNVTTTGGATDTITVAVVSNPTFSGVVTASAAGTALSVTNNATIGGILTAGSLIVSSGGASVTGGINNNSGGITNAGTISGATISGGSNTITNIANSSLTNSSLTVTAGTNLSGGGTVSLGGSTTLNIVSNPTFTGLITGSNTGGTALALTGAPAASTTQSLLRLGNAIASGDVDGTFIGLNAITGYTGNLVDLQVNGSSKFSINENGNVVAGNISAGTLTAGTYNGQTISSSASFSGSLTVASGFTVTAGAVSLPAGSVANAALANSSITVTAGTGLSGGGSVALGGTVSLNLPNVGTAGTYGSATQVPVFTTDAQGRITGVTNTTISVGTASLFTASGTSGSSQTISGGDTLTIAAGTNVTTTGGATDTITVAVVNNPTFSGVVTASAAGTALSVTNNATISGILTAGSLVVSSGGASITGGINNNSGGITNAGTVSGATIAAGSNTITGLTNTNLSGSAGITNANLANSSLTVTAGTNLSGGGSVALGSSTTLNIVSNPTFSGLITGSNTGGTALALTGAPAASTTQSLLRLGNAIAGGDVDGTFIGLNAITGYTGNLVDLQVNGTSKFSINESGNVVAGNISAGTLTAGTYNGQTISSSASFTGSLTVASGFTVSAGAVSLPAGSVANAALANSSITITAGTGLSGGGSVALGGTVSLNLPNVGTAGTYGSATQVPVFTTDAQGRITGVTNTTITVGTATLFTVAGTSGSSQTISGGDTLTIAAGSNVTTTGSATDTLTVAVVSNPTFGGLVTGSAGLTVTGAAINLNASSNFATNIGTGTSTGAVSLGGGSNTFALDSTALDISTAGALTGVTGITSSGAYTQSGTSGNTFTGALTVSRTGANALAITGAPASSATSSLLQIGSALVSGSSLGAYIGLNGASGYNGDFVRIQDNGTNIFLLDNSGDLTMSGNITTTGDIDAGYITGTDLLITGAGSFGLNGGALGQVSLSGSTSGTVAIKPQAAAGTYNFNLPTSAGTSGYILTSAGGGASPMTWTNPSTLGVAWSSIANPSGNLSLSMGTNTTTFNYATGTGSSNLFNYTTANASDGTGYLVNIATGTTSTVKPLKVSAAGTDIFTIAANGATVLAGSTTVSGALSATGAGTSLAVTNNATIGGTLAVTGTVTGGTYNGQTISSSASFTGTLATAGALTVSAGGASITGGINNNAGGITNVGALTGVTGVTTNGAYTQSGTNANTFTGATTFSAAGTALAVTNDATIGGTLAVTGTVTGGTYNGQTISSSASFTGTVAAATSFSAPLYTGTGAISLLAGGTGALSIATTTQSSGTTGAVTLNSGNGTVTGISGAVAIGSGSTSAGASGSLTLQTGASTTSTTGAVTIRSGNGGGVGNSGAISIDSGTSGAGTPGAITIGTANATSITIGRSGQTVTLPGMLAVGTATSGFVLGSGANGTTLSSTATSARAISFPDAAGTIALTTSTVTAATNLAGGSAGQVPYQSGASTTAFVGGSAGQVFISNGTSAPSFVNLASTITAGTNISITGTTNPTINVVTNPTFSGLVTAQLGLNVTGAVVNINASSNFATNINTGTSTGAVSIGGGSGTFAVDSTALDISTAGAITGVTGITTTGGYTQSGTTANTFTGASTFSAAGTGLAVTNNATVGGKIGLNGRAVGTDTIDLQSGGTDLGILMRSSGGTFSRWGFDSSGNPYIGANGANSLTFLTNGLGRLLIAATGEVGVGTTTTTNGFLTVRKSTSGTALAVRNTGDSATTFSVTDTGAVSLAGGLTVTASGASITGGINNNTGGITNAGAITGVTGITTTGAYTQSGSSANTFTGASTFSAAGSALAVTNNATIGGTLSVGSVANAGYATSFASSTTANLPAVYGIAYNGAGTTVNNAGVFGNAYVTTGTDFGVGVLGNSTGARSGGGGTNIGGYFLASGAGSNYALLTGGGKVGIGAASPISLFSVGSSSQFQVNSSGAIAASTGITISGGYTQSGTNANTFTGATTFSAAGTGLAVTNNATVGGTVAITGNVGIQGGTGFAPLVVGGAGGVNAGFEVNPASASSVIISSYNRNTNAYKNLLLDGEFITLRPSGTTVFQALTGGVAVTGGYTQSGTTANSFSGASSFTASGTALVVTNNATIGGTLAVTGLITGSAGLTVTGAAINLNASSNFGTNINTGTSTGVVTIGNSANTVGVAAPTTFSASGTALTVTNDATVGGNLGIGGAATAARATIAGNISAAAWGVNGVALRVSSATYTDSTSSGTVTNIAASSFATPTFAASSTTTFTNAATVLINAAPSAGTNVTLTRPYALFVNSGNSRFDGDVGLSITGTLDSRLAISGLRSGAAGGNTGALFSIASGTITDTTSSGTAANVSAASIGQATLAASSTTTYTNAASLQISNAPTAGTNATITNAYALRVVAGSSYFGGTIAATGLITATGGIESAAYSTFTGGLKVGLTNAVIDSRFNVSGAYTSTSAFSSSGKNISIGGGNTYTDGVTTAGSTISVAAVNSITSGVLNFTNASSTITHAAGLYINGAPSAGANATITNSYALYVAAGGIKVSGGISNSTGGITSTGIITGVTGITSSGDYTQSGTNANTFTGATTFSAAGTALAVTNDATIGGTLAVTGTVTGGTYNGQTISSSASLTGTLSVATSITSPIVNVGTAGASTGKLNLSGATSGTVTIQTQAAADTYNFNLPTTAGTSGYVLTSAGGGASPMTWTDASSLAVRWNAITNPTGNQSLTMGTNTTAWNYATGTSTNNLFNLTTDASANGTGSLLNIQTGASSTVIPMRVRAGAVEGLLVDASGNVGVGTTAPGAKLSISTNGTSLLSLTHDATNGVISTSTGAIYMQAASGILAVNKSGVQNRVRVYGSGGTVYGEITNDNTNTIISSSSGELQLQGAGTNQLILGSVGSAMNLIFEESSTISGQGTNTITVGQSGDIFNLNASGVTYNVAGLASTGATLTTSATGTVAFTINGPSGLVANLLNLAVNGSNRLTVTTAGALSTVSSLTSTVTGANALALSGAPAGSSTASLVQMGSAIAGGSASGTYLGLNATGGFAGNFVDFQVSGTNYFKVTSSGATSSAATAAVFAANSATESAFQATGTPTSNAAKSLLQLGSAIAVGSSGGNYVGINSGSGFTGNFLELEKNGAQVLAVTADSQLSLTRATPVAADWAQLNSNGFGSANNTTSQSLVTFGDAVFTATSNSTAGTQVYKSTDSTTWTQVNTSGFGSTGRTAATAITSFGGAVYVSTANGETFRSFNGTTWTQAADLGSTNGSGVRSFFTAQGYLYAASAASSGGAYIERTSNGTTWTTVGTAGLGDANNTEIASGIYYNGAYYFGTLNTTSGSKLYRSYDLSTFTQVNTSGFGSANNTTVRSLLAYNGSLYATTGNTSTGSQTYNSPDGAAWTQVNTSGYGSSATSTSLAAVAYKGVLIISLGNSSVGMKLYGVQTGTIKSASGGLAVKSAQIGDVLIENASIKGVSELTAGTISAQTVGARNLQVADGIAVNSSPTYTGNLVEYKANDTSVFSTTISGATKLSPWRFTSVLETTTSETAFTDVTATANANTAYSIFKNSGASLDRTYFGYADSPLSSFTYTETAGSGGNVTIAVCTALTGSACLTWTTISGGIDGTSNMTQTGTASWTNTQVKAVVNEVSAYWIRMSIGGVAMSVGANGIVRASTFETATATSAGVAFMLQAPYTANATGWATGGTFIGVNRETAFSGNFLDFKAAGTSVFTVSASGGVTIAASSVSTTLLTVTQIASQTADTIAVGKVFVVDTTGKLASSESLPGVPLVGVDPNSGATRGDLTSSAGPLRPYAGAGLTLNVTAGSAYTADHYTSGSSTTIRRCVIPSDTTIAMTASTTEYVYLIASTTDTTTGKQCTVAKNATLPTFNAQYPVLVLAKVVSGASITSVADTRFFIGSTLVYAVSTSSVEPGSIIIQNTAVDNQVDDSNSAASTGVVGITAVGNTASGIFILNKSGTAWTQAVSTAARGVCAGTSTTTGAVNNITAAVTACAGRVMTNAASATPAVLVQISPN